MFFLKKMRLQRKMDHLTKYKLHIQENGFQEDAVNGAFTNLLNK